MPAQARPRLAAAAAPVVDRLDSPAGPDQPVLLGLISDTHGVLCDEVLERLRGVSAILHAGDVGHHGRHEGVLSRLRGVAPVFAVAGNVDDSAAVKEAPAGAAPAAGGAGVESPADAAPADGGPPLLPVHRLLHVAGWRLLVTHIAGQPPDALAPEAARLVAEHRPDAVVFGHSHKHAAHTSSAPRFYNPGSAGPARFKLPRTAALLQLPPGGPGSGAEPVFTLVPLAPRAPPRLAAKGTASKKRSRRPTASPAERGTTEARAEAGPEAPSEAGPEADLPAAERRGAPAGPLLDLVVPEAPGLAPASATGVSAGAGRTARKGGLRSAGEAEGAEREGGGGREGRTRQRGGRGKQTRRNGGGTNGGGTAAAARRTEGWPVLTEGC